MRVGSTVYPDFPINRADWRQDWPDKQPGIVIEELEFNTFMIMTGSYLEEVHIEYLVEVV
jgi:hypothetical protein